MNLKRIWERIGNWEQWPFELRYLLITPVWAWYCIRAGSLWFFTPSNPGITFGGFEGEGKREMYELLPSHTYPTTIFIMPGEPFDLVKEKIPESDIKNEILHFIQDSKIGVIKRFSKNEVDED